LLDEGTARAVLDRTTTLLRKTTTSALVAIAPHLAAVAPLVMQFLALESHLANNSDLMVGDPVLKEFKRNNDEPLIERAKRFIEGSTKEIYYLINDQFYLPERLAKEQVLLGNWIAKLPETKDESPEQQLLRGLRFQRGWSGIPLDEKKSEALYRSAAEKIPLGDTLLGLLYLKNNKYKEAIDCFTKAAKDYERLLYIN